MKEIIIATLAKLLFDTKPDSHKRITVVHSIEDMKTGDLPAFIASLCLPPDTETWFDTHIETDGSEVYQGSWPVIRYHQYVSLTDTERLEQIKRRFNVNSSRVHKALAENGYKRIPMIQDRNKKFPTVYDMYMAGEYDLLVDYYLQYFRP